MANAKSAGEHLKLAAYYEERASRLDAQAEAYERAVAACGHSPAVKNLAAPNTAARYANSAKTLHDEARSARAKAASQQLMAKAADAVIAQVAGDK